MKPTIDYLQERFAHFNTLCFEGKLPPVPIALSNARTFLGKCVCREKRGLLGLLVKREFTLRISTAFELTADELDDILIHEMIHYYIGVNNLHDTSSHGKQFRHMMNTINSRHGRHITISHRSTPGQAQDTRQRWHVVAVVTLTNGKTGIKVLPRIAQRVITFYNSVMTAREVSYVTLYLSNDPYFNRFPTSSVLKVHYIDPTDLTPHLKGSHNIQCDTSGKNLRVSPTVNR